MLSNCSSKRSRNRTIVAFSSSNEAAAKAKASQTARGVIQPAPKPAEAPVPPVDPGKLKLSDSLTMPPSN